MKIARKVFTLLLILCCASSLFAPAFADMYFPKSAGTPKGTAVLSISSSGLATCTASAETDSASHHIEMVLVLYRINGSSTTALKSWVVEGDRKISETKTHYVLKGYDYQLISTITVTDANGTIIDSFDTPSSIVHY